MDYCVIARDLIAHILNERERGGEKVAVSLVAILALPMARYGEWSSPSTAGLRGQITRNKK